MSEEQKKGMWETISLEPSWRCVASMAIMSIRDGDGKGAELIIRDMGDKLARIRASQSDCPDHLKEEEETIANLISRENK